MVLIKFDSFRDYPEFGMSAISFQGEPGEMEFEPMESTGVGGLVDKLVMASYMHCKKEIRSFSQLINQAYEADLRKSRHEQRLGFGDVINEKRKDFKIVPLEKRDSIPLATRHKINEIFFTTIFTPNRNAVDRLSEYTFQLWEKSIAKISLKDKQSLLLDLYNNDFISQEFLDDNLIVRVSTLKDSCLKTICEKIKETGRTTNELENLPLPKNEKDKLKTWWGREYGPIVAK